jgi:flagellar hook capping protein FlgD
MNGHAMSTWSRLVITIVALSLSAGRATAQTWFQPDGQPIYTLGNNHPPKLLPDGAGGAVFVWANASTGNVYVQRVNGAGQVPPCPTGGSCTDWWTQVPKLLSFSSGGQDNPAVARNCGGTYVAWEDARNAASEGLDVFVNFIGDDGLVANELKVDDNFVGDPGNQTNISIAASFDRGTEDGAVLVWESDDNLTVGNRKIYVQKAPCGGCTGEICDLLYTPDSLGVTPECGTIPRRTHPAIVSDQLGGALIAWEDYRNATGDIYVQHVGRDGRPDAAFGTCALLVSVGAHTGATDSRTWPRMASDGKNGAFVVWTDRRNGNPDIYGAHIKVEGAENPATEVVTVTEFPVGTLTGDDLDPEVIPDGATGTDGRNGALIAWRHIDVDLSNGFTDSDIYCQRIDASGATHPGWLRNGVVVCAAAGAQMAPQMSPDGTGGALVTWQDERPVPPPPGVDVRPSKDDIYLQDVKGDGTLATRWLATQGKQLVASTQAQVRPAIITSPAGAGLVAWTDASTGAPGVAAEDVLGATVAVQDAPGAERPGVRGGEPNPFRSRVRFSVTLPSPAAIVLEVFDPQGRRVRTLARGHYPAGAPVFEWDGMADGGTRAAAGVYIVRTRIDGAEWRDKLVRLR